MIGVDTNVLVALINASHPARARQALHAVTAARKTNGLLLSAQVCGEFMHVTTRKLQPPLHPDEARQFLRALGNLPAVQQTHYELGTILRARNEQPTWDAILAQTLLDAGCTELLTENVDDFAGTGLVARNPFESPTNNST